MRRANPGRKAGTAQIGARVGPERPTIAEEVVRLLHLPYLLGCTIWALALLEIPIILWSYLTPHEPRSGQVVLYLVVVFLMSVYFPMSVRFVRARLLESEQKIAPVLSAGEAGYHEAFGRSVSYPGQIAIIAAIALMAVYVIIRSGALVDRVINSVCSAYIATMLGSLIWFNLGCFAGLYQLGGKPLKFKSFQEDPKLGTKPIGSLCLSLSGSYFVGVILLILFSAASPNDLYRIPYLWAIYTLLILVGLAMFFLPIYRVHTRMVEEKSRQELLIQRHFGASAGSLETGGAGNPLEGIQRLLALDMADRKLQKVSTWPFDTRIMGRLLAILISVLTALFARYLADRFLTGIFK